MSAPRKAPGWTQPPAPSAPSAQVASAPSDYEGLITRGLAFGIDAAIVCGVSVIVGAAVAATLSVLSIPSEVENFLFAFGGLAFLLWSMGYFVTFWSTTGQTPGNRILGIRVCRAGDGAALPPRRAVLRLLALALAVIPLFAGFLPILFDNRRRGIHDMIARTVVIGADEDEGAETSAERGYSPPQHSG